MSLFQNFNLGTGLELLVERLDRFYQNLVLNFSGNEDLFRRLTETQKIPRRVIDYLGVMASLYLLNRGSEDIKILGNTSLVFSLADIIQMKRGAPFIISEIIHIIYNSPNVIRSYYAKKHAVKGLNLGDNQLVYLMHHLSVEQKQDLINLLERVNKASKDLPTCGVELGYPLELPKDRIAFLNETTLVVPNQVRKSYSSRYGSEIRVLSTNPFSFRWLLQEIGDYFPETSFSVQICVGREGLEITDDQRMPYIFLALYFMNGSCAFPIVENSRRDYTISFPSAYVGATVLHNGVLGHGSQINYFVMYSSNPQEISDAAFYAAKLHSLKDEQFREFQEELLGLLGMRNDPINKLLAEWSDRFDNCMGPYKIPENFRLVTIEKAKRNLGLKPIEQKWYDSFVNSGGKGVTLTEEEADTVASVVRTMRQLLEKHTVTHPRDIAYRCSLEEALRR